MMDHRTDETLLAYLDGELAEGERAACEAHLSGCGTCAASLANLRSASRQLAEALETLDVSGVPAAPPRARVDRRRRWAPRTFAKAAVLVIAAAGAATAAVPGSPLRAWIGEAVERVAGLFGGEPAAIQEEARARAVDLPGVAVAPTGGAGGVVRIELTRPHPDAIVRVRLVEGERAAVWSERARYRTGPGRIEVVEAGAGELRIEIPRSAREARVEVDGRLAVLKEGPELRLVAAGVDSAGAEVLFRAGRDSATVP
jgi:anti-sigma factor RsiW